MKFFLHTLTRPILWVLLLGMTLPVLSGCFGIAVVGATTGVFAITDRRSLGTQTEDSAIEFKAGSYISQSVKDVSHFNLTSYNRRVLLTGEVPNESIKTQLGNEAARIENVLGVMNELVVASNSSLTARANDSLITSKVKARFIDANEFSLHHVKVVTEASTVFLLGIVSSKEAAAAIQIARTTSGVRKIVNRMMVESDAEIERIDKSLANSAKTN
ncbi:MAG: BON domain-containing protein [Zoogloeaceae bacterium]|jgi:osmotically-inducible protein OsmY|nr:BON domain-containing protein [Zoogloeaceae bacterium]